MCRPEFFQAGQKQSSASKMNMMSWGARLDQAQRANSSAAAGGTTAGGGQNPTILAGVPRGTDVDAMRKTSLLGV